MTRAPTRRGVAVVLAMLFVTLASGAAAYLPWTRSAWPRYDENDVARGQVGAVPRAAAQGPAAMLAAGDMWADPVDAAGVRRLPALPADEVTLTGAVADEQAKFNLNNLARGVAPNPAEVAVLQRLLGLVGLPATLADAIVDWIDPDDAVPHAAGAEESDARASAPARRPPTRSLADVGELARVQGMTPEALARLALHLTALPDETPVNVNTASATLLRAVAPSLSADGVARLVEERGRAPFRGIDDFQRALTHAGAAQVDAPIGVRSRYFSAAATVRVGRVTAQYRALIERGEHGRTVIVALTPVLPGESVAEGAAASDLTPLLRTRALKEMP